MFMDVELKKMLGKSVMFHVSIVLIFTIKTFFFTSDIPKYDPAIRVDLIGLPDKKSPDEPMIQPKTEAAPAKVTVDAKTKKAEKPTLPDKTKKQNEALNKLKAMNAIDKLKAQDSERQEKEALEKAAASKVIKGNVISPGSALKGLSKLEFDTYIGSIDAHVKNNWALPEWMLQQNLKAEVLVKFDQNGNLTERRFIKKSGNPDFDQRVWSSIEKSSPFPAPPDKFVDIVGVQGITFAFPD